MHVSLYVSDMQRSIAFYTSFFGTEPVKIKPGYTKFILEQPSLIISFVESKERVNQNFGHLGFQVESPADLEHELQKAKANGFIAREEVGTNCCYAKQDKFWVNDPDGVQWEVYYFHEDAEFNDPHYAGDDAVACCTVSSEDSKSSCGCNAEVSTASKSATCC
jgi:catechol 2,3-dioxygenase-like lactoylglutathione lyase family enzyme